MALDHTSYSLGSLSLHRTAEPDTLSAYSAFHADASQFCNPQALLHLAEGSDMQGREQDEILVAEVTTAITFFDPISLSGLSDVDVAQGLADKFNDQINFHVRVCGNVSATLPFLRRLKAPQRETRVSGLAFIESVATAPGFDPMDALSAGLKQLTMLTATSGEGIFWIQSVRDLAESQSELHAAMADQYAFKKKYPQWSTTTFPDIGPLSGTMAGFIPARARWAPEEDWCRIGCTHEVRPDYLDGAEEAPDL